MGARGPRPAPVDIKKLKGNPGKEKLPPPGVTASGEPFIPEHLEADARACIDVVQSSMPPGLYRRVDSFILASFAIAWALHKKAAEHLRTTAAYTVETARGEQVSPWVRILNDQAKLMASLGDRLGLDPKSRAALHLPDEKPASKFDGLVGNARALRLVK
jgi:P27 family predicted phage terminase small subunit